MAVAGGSAPVSLDKLISASDNIIVGKIADGSASGVAVTLSIEIERVMKGQLKVGGIVAATATISEPSQFHQAARDRGVFFLSGAQSGPLRLISPLSGYLHNERSAFIPLPNVAATAMQAGGTLRDQVMLEVLGAIESGEALPPGGAIDVLWEYQIAPTAAVRSAFQRWMQGGSPKLIALSLEALVSEGDIAALTRVATDDSLKENPAANSIFDRVKLFKNTDPNAVTILGGLATTTSVPPRLRTVAATALARMHTALSLPYLAQLLSDPNPALQAAGVGGLSSFANNVPMGSHEPAAGDWKYRTDDTIAHSAFDESLVTQRQAYYVGFWRSWWNQNQTELAR
jgi:hypothetical protein